MCVCVCVCVCVCTHASKKTILINESRRKRESKDLKTHQRRKKSFSVFRLLSSSLLLFSQRF